MKKNNAQSKRSWSESGLFKNSLWWKVFVQQVFSVLTLKWKTARVMDNEIGEGEKEMRWEHEKKASKKVGNFWNEPCLNRHRKTAAPPPSETRAKQDQARNTAPCLRISDILT